MMWQEEGCIMYEIILHEFLDHYFVSCLCTLKPTNFFSKKPRFFTKSIYRVAS